MKDRKGIQEPLISIVLPSFNSSSLIKKCIRSVLATSYSNFEVIVVDDCSTDRSFDFVQKIAERFSVKGNPQSTKLWSFSY